MTFDELAEKYRAMGESEIEAAMYYALRRMAKAYRESRGAGIPEEKAIEFVNALNNCVAIGESLGPGVDQ